MAKLIYVFIFVAICFSVIGGWMEGGGGVEAVILQANITATSTTMTIDNTTGYLAADIISIDDEYIAYTSRDATHFYGLSRGERATSPANHKAGAYVYSESASGINKALGFNAAAITASNGLYSVVVIPFNFLTITLPYLMFYQFVMFEGEMMIFRYLLMAAGISLYVVLAIAIGQVVGYVLKAR